MLKINVAFICKMSVRVSSYGGLVSSDGEVIILFMSSGKNLDDSQCEEPIITSTEFIM